MTTLYIKKHFYFYSTLSEIDKSSIPVCIIAMTSAKDLNNAENSFSTFGKCKKEPDYSNER